MASNSTTFTLKPWPAKAKPAEPLRSLIGRIHKQKGHFRNLDEEKLQDEIRAIEQGVTDEQVDNEDDNGAQDYDSVRKEFYANREELRKFIGQAENEALMGLDFISLLLTKDAPLKGEQSMSPALKNMTPAGTLTFDKTQADVRTKEIDAGYEHTISGWTLQSLNNTADSLLSAATNLQAEMQREAKYWTDVLSMKEKGFSVYRPQKSNPTLAVRYGYNEAAPQFQAQGVAPLRQDPDGSVKLGRSLSKQPKILQISVVHGSQAVHVSTLPTKDLTTPETAGALVQRASDSIFEEDLFHELSREARNLLAYGIKIVDQTIHVPFKIPSTTDQDHEPSTLKIELKPATEHFDIPEEADNTMADGIALMLRIGLANVYRQKLHTRSLPPPPLSDEARPAPVHGILSSLLGFFEHLENVEALNRWLGVLSRSLGAFGLSAKRSSKSQRPDLYRLLQQSNSAYEGLVDRMTKEFSPPFATSIHFETFHRSSLSIKIVTDLRAPSFGTTFQITSTDFDGSEINTSFSDRVDLMGYVSGALEIAVVQHISGQNLGWKQQQEGILCKLGSSTEQGGTCAVKVRIHRGDIVFVRGTRAKGGAGTSVHKIDPIKPESLRDVLSSLENSSSS